MKTSIVVTLPVRVTLSGENLKEDEAQVLARLVLESSNFSSTDLPISGTHEYDPGNKWDQEGDTSSLVHLDHIECDTTIRVEVLNG